ncbi:MAG: hypothetical protein VXY77_00550 [Pseudomonadota bacterium]|nr:hypothetical protein [Pseudomonadota bacterium]
MEKQIQDHVGIAKAIHDESQKPQPSLIRTKQSAKSLKYPKNVRL